MSSTTEIILMNAKRNIPLLYKEIVLPHKYYADFIVFDKIILEIKSCTGIADEFFARTINYLAASKLNVGLIINCGKDSLAWKRLVL